MKSYVDVMDPARVVQVVQDSKTPGKVVCKVFWKGQTAGKVALTYGGQVEISKNLFLTGDEPEYSQVSRIGFLPESKAVRLEPKPKLTKPTRGKRRDEDFEDEE